MGEYGGWSEQGHNAYRCFCAAHKKAEEIRIRHNEELRRMVGSGWTKEDKRFLRSHVAVLAVTEL